MPNNIKHIIAVNNNVMSKELEEFIMKLDVTDDSRNTLTELVKDQMSVTEAQAFSLGMETGKQVLKQAISCL